MIAAVDPEGVRLRKRNRLTRRRYGSKVSSYQLTRNAQDTLTQGPNFCWHMDGNDKLKAYGFSSHGCIDGWVITFCYGHR